MELNVVLTHIIRSYRDSNTKENVDTQKRKPRGGNDRKRAATTKIKNTTKKGKKPLICVWSLAYILSDLRGPTSNMEMLADSGICLFFSESKYLSQKFPLYYFFYTKTLA